jgi:Na+/proline symporter
VRLFLPALAVVVGLANALLYNAFGNSPQDGPFVWKLQFGPMFTVLMLSAVLAGLIVSGALRLLAERKLR